MSMDNERIKHIEKRLDDYWDYDFVDADLANEMQGYAVELLSELKKLRAGDSK